MKNLYALSFILLSSVSFGQVFTATYDFASILSSAKNGLIDPTLPPVVAGLTFSSFTAANLDSNLNSSATGRFSYAKQPLGAVANSNVYAEQIGSLEQNTYFTFTITPAIGTSFDLSKITFKIQRSASGIRTFSVRSNVDNYNSNLPASVTSSLLSVEADNVFFVSNDVSTTATNNVVTLSNTNITSPITFRIYGWNAEKTTGTFSIDDVVVTGKIKTLSVEQNQITGLSIYPNPVSKGILYITSDSNEVKSVVIFDVLGKEILSTTTSNNAINVTSLKPGVYILKIIENGKIATQKLIIE